MTSIHINIYHSKHCNKIIMKMPKITQRKVSKNESGDVLVHVKHNKKNLSKEDLQVD